ncbi:MAG: formate C-acetyltransferase, partial [Erysipelotrichaceae bacterium]|nr:formate C-acetyltransferase [Erysipelotrichaceae bacterium]
DLERALLYTESYKETEGQPVIIRRAKALRHILENHVIVIDDDDLLVGNRTVKPRAGVISPEMSPYWILDEIDEFETRPQDKFVFAETDKQIYREYLYPYWAGRSLKDYYDSHVDESVVKATKTKIFAINQTDKGQGHIIPDYTVLLDNGFGNLLEDIKEKTKENPDNEFYQAAEICLEASVAYILRYQREVRKKTESCTDENRKKELENISAILGKIAYEKPDTLYEAVQLFWLFCVILQHESNASSVSIGRFDQYMYKYWVKETDTAFVKELLDCFYLKTNTIVFIRSKESAKFFAGFPSGYTMAVGGVNENGNDATNEFSKLLIRLHEDIGLPQPNLSLRMHEHLDDDLLKICCETIRLGNGLPQIFGDEVNIDGFVKR